MRSSTTDRFRTQLRSIPLETRLRVAEHFRVWQRNPKGEESHVKITGNFWSMRAAPGYRALGRKRPHGLVWFWIGTLDAYDKAIAEGELDLA